MSFIIGILTAVLVLTCILLVFLVLIQLPKKEAGLGVAFGAAATDALFGAGSGNALTKLTRYSTVVFLCLSLVLSILISRQNRLSDPGFGAGVDRTAAQQAGQAPGAGAAQVIPALPTNTGANATQAPTVIQTNVPPAGTNQQ
jgi:preprotein translocase subunit SecG